MKSLSRLLKVEKDRKDSEESSLHFSSFQLKFGPRLDYTGFNLRAAFFGISKPIYSSTILPPELKLLVNE